MENDHRSVTLSADSSAGQQADIELVEANALWVGAGPGIEVVHVWMKGVAGLIDLRVLITKAGSTVEAAIDRGEQSRKWWPPNAAPRILIELDEVKRVALATVSVGAATTVQTAELGSVSY